QPEVARLLEAARHLQPPLRALTYETLLGLVAASGMRLGEAIGLTRDDVNLTEGVLTIREAKFGRSRLVPLHQTATDALRSYATRRDRLCSAPRSRTFFLSSVGTVVIACNVQQTFGQLTTAIGLRT